MISFKCTGSFKNTEKFFSRVLKRYYFAKLNEYGREGVAALASATPKDTGKTADSWRYEIVEKNGKVSVCWSNINVNDGVNIAIILQYGHGTKNGGYVVGRDYINPAIRPIFDRIASQAWMEVCSS